MEGQSKEANPNEAKPPLQVKHENENSSEVTVNVTSSSLENFSPESSSSSSATFVTDDTETMICNAAESPSTFSNPNGKRCSDLINMI